MGPMPEISPGRSDRLSVVDKGMVRLTWPTNPGGIGPGLAASAPEPLGQGRESVPSSRSTVLGGFAAVGQDFGVVVLLFPVLLVFPPGLFRIIRGNRFRGHEPPSVRDRVIISNIIANFVHDHE